MSLQVSWWMLTSACTLILSFHEVLVAEKILFLPLQQTSHTKLQQSIAEEMHDRGHQTYTVLGSRFGAKIRQKSIVRNSEILSFEQLADRKYTGANVDQLFANLLQDYSKEKQQETWDESVRIFTRDCDDMMADNDFLASVRARNIDYAVIDYWHAIPCSLLLAHNLSIPYLVNAATILPWLLREPGLPSFVPFVLSQKSEKMSFWERLTNTFDHWYFYQLPSPSRLNVSLLQRHAPAISGWNQLLENSLLYLEFRDHILEWPQPTMPNHIRLFGLSYHEPKNLTQELDTIASQNEIILVSFGSMGGKLPLKYVDKLMETFQRFPDYAFIFSYSGDVARLARKPAANVYIFSWLPQNDLLAQRRSRLFITHGGHNGQSEALFHGVPMMTMPLYFEQFHNAFRVQSHKFGLTVNIYEFTPNELEMAIREVLHNPIYTANVKHASAILRSLPDSVKVAGNWIEHVMRFGSEHLRTSAYNLTWCQYLMIDVLGALAIVVSFVAFVAYFPLSKLRRAVGTKTKATD